MSSNFCYYYALYYYIILYYSRWLIDKLMYIHIIYIKRVKNRPLISISPHVAQRDVKHHNKYFVSTWKLIFFQFFAAFTVELRFFSPLNVIDKRTLRGLFSGISTQRVSVWNAKISKAQKLTICRHPTVFKIHICFLPVRRGKLTFAQLTTPHHSYIHRNS